MKNNAKKEEKPLQLQELYLCENWSAIIYMIMYSNSNKQYNNLI